MVASRPAYLQSIRECYPTQADGRIPLRARGPNLVDIIGPEDHELSTIDEP